MNEGNKNSQQQSAPESNREIPPVLLPAEPSLRHHETTQLSPFISYVGDQQAHDQSSTYQDFFNMLSNVELLSPAPPPPPPPAPPPPSFTMLLNKMESVGGGFEKGESSGTKRTSDVVQVSVPPTQSEVSTQEVELEAPRPPRTRRRRSAQVHNMSERTRRGQITEKIRSLQEIVPNCSKTDKASVLADTIEYIKFLQQQFQMKSMYERMLVPYYTSVFPMRPMMGVGPGYGMGMYGSPYPTGFPMTPFPQGLNPFGEPGFLHPPSQLQFPSVGLGHTAETTLPTATASTGPTTATPSTSITRLSSTFSQGESSSAQSIPRIDSDLNQSQILQGSRQQGFTSMVQASQIVRRPSSFRSGSADQEIFPVDEEAQKFRHDSTEQR